MSRIRSRSPKFSKEQAASVARSLYGLTEFVRELPSERDQNFLFSANGRKFILKISNRDETREVLDAQNEAIRRVANGTEVIEARDGNAVTIAAAPDGSEHFVRLVSFIPGVPLAEFRPHSDKLLHNLGRMLARVDMSLSGMTHTATRRDLYWDIRNAEQVIESWKDLIEDNVHRGHVETILSEWREQAVPRLTSLRTSVIHNDANDYNVIVKDDSSIGLIDFGDMVETYTVAEPAIACAYVMLHKPDPIAAAAAVIRGYHDLYPLIDIEIELLYFFIRIRLAMSVTIAAHQKRLEPDNEYLRISEEPIWKLLDKLASVNGRLAHCVFRHASGRVPCPQSDSIISFLRRGSLDAAQVVEEDLAGDDAIVLDLSIGSLEIGTTEEAGDVERMTRTLFRKLQDAGARVGIGRYKEPRGLYTSPLFSTESNDGPEWRTVHLGIDIFMEAGSSIHVPLDGTVHSFRNNDAPLDYGPTIVLKHLTDTGQEFFTLYGHLSESSLDGLFVGKPVRRGETIATIGTYPTNGGWPPHLHFQIVVDMLDRDGEFPGVAAPSQLGVWLSLSPDPNLILRIPAKKFPKEPETVAETASARRRLIGPNVSLAYQTPLKVVRGSGAYLYDEMGRGYLDCVNNVAHVGHCHPDVVRAARRQLAILNTNTRYLHDNIVEYARLLTDTLPEPLSVCYFVNSGSEANDLALRLAQAHINSKKVIAMAGAYHGNLTSLVDISPYKFDGPGGRGAPPHVHTVCVPDGYRGPFKYEDDQAGANYASVLKEAAIGPVTFISESLLSCGGQIVLPDGYLADAFRFVRAAGGVCIADEVQIGFGRVGTHFWGFETQGVVPDIVTMGKSIGNGHPSGAVVTTREIAESFNNGMEYFNTFGGNPVSSAVGLAVLRVLEEEDLQSRARILGDDLKREFKALGQSCELIGDVRGLGLFLGIELVRNRQTLEPAPSETAYIVERMKDRGILLSMDGPFHNVIKIKPPMVFSHADAARLVAELRCVLAENQISSPVL